MFYQREVFISKGVTDGGKQRQRIVEMSKEEPEHYMRLHNHSYHRLCAPADNCETFLNGEVIS